MSAAIVGEIKQRDDRISELLQRIETERQQHLTETNRLKAETKAAADEYAKERAEQDRSWSTVQESLQLVESDMQEEEKDVNEWWNSLQSDLRKWRQRSDQNQSRHHQLSSTASAHFGEIEGELHALRDQVKQQRREALAQSKLIEKARQDLEQTSRR